MSRAKPPRETHRECRGCKQVLELNVANFARHETSKGGFKGRCRECLREDARYGEKKRQGRLAAIKSAPKPLKNGQRCPECEGLGHRRPLSGCPRCQLPHVPEAKVEPVLRRYAEVG